MDNEVFKTWRKVVGLTQAQAAEALGVSKATIENYERGSRREDGRPVEIPRHIALACAAIYHKFGPWRIEEPKGQSPS
ncbi:helix-turn-helix transcriptional regulator [Xanthobacter dioxanivorans]|uniref:Helix-turn-helix transcriptional regulator n=1 Tax=Xanthobacter dioxanivorans TaxID=2528964 RepID=A0A974PMV1_9HYPH|nr:helix-turn-helix transcriptional regulator [Xanthobacter dioxanivorans]QRG06109.1 helix-turn-helix transcriptional regulator [Xanthobacter dioxanivorans]